MNRAVAVGLALALAGAPGLVAARQKPPPGPPLPKPPENYTVVFADQLAAVANHRPLSIRDLRRIASGTEQQTDTLDGRSYGWFITRPACSSSLVARLTPGGGGPVVTISTPDDVSVQINEHGTMQCTPIDCATARTAETETPTAGRRCD